MVRAHIYSLCAFFPFASLRFEENEKRSEGCINANRKRNESTALKFNYGNWMAAPRSEAYRKRTMVECVCVSVSWRPIFIECIFFLYRPISIFATVIRLRAVTVGGFYTTRKFLCGKHFRKRANKKAWKNKNEGTTIPQYAVLSLSLSLSLSLNVQHTHFSPLFNWVLFYIKRYCFYGTINLKHSFLSIILTMEMSQWKDKLSVKNVLYVYACQSHHHPFSHLTPHFFFVVILPLLLLFVVAVVGIKWHWIFSTIRN